MVLECNNITFSRLLCTRHHGEPVAACRRRQPRLAAADRRRPPAALGRRGRRLPQLAAVITVMQPPPAAAGIYPNVLPGGPALLGTCGTSESPSAPR